MTKLAGASPRTGRWRGGAWAKAKQDFSLRSKGKKPSPQPRHCETVSASQRWRGERLAFLAAVARTFRGEDEMHDQRQDDQQNQIKEFGFACHISPPVGIIAGCVRFVPIQINRNARARGESWKNEQRIQAQFLTVNIQATS
jgi:hypothetical protein